MQVGAIEGESSQVRIGYAEALALLRGADGGADGTALLQVGGHPFAVLLQGFPLHRIPYPLKGLVDARQVLGGCLPAVGRRRPLSPCCRPAPGLPGAP